jgi:hypothetical protein
LNFRPRLTVVLIFLTLTVAVVGYRIARDAGTRRVEGMAQEAQRIFAAAQKEGTKDAPPDPGVIEEKILEWLGMKVTLPRDESLFSYKGATRERFGKQTAAAVSLAFGEDRFLLLIVRPDPVRGVEAPSPLFSEASFLSWEKEGNSFVYWEKDGAKYVLVSNVDLSRTFDLVRRYFT